MEYPLLFICLGWSRLLNAKWIIWPGISSSRCSVLCVSCRWRTWTLKDSLATSAPSSAYRSGSWRRCRTPTPSVRGRSSPSPLSPPTSAPPFFFKRRTVESGANQASPAWWLHFALYSHFSCQHPRHSVTFYWFNNCHHDSNARQADNVRFLGCLRGLLVAQSEIWRSFIVIPVCIYMDLKLSSWLKPIRGNKVD